jgi:hypothetical protein
VTKPLAAYQLVMLAGQERLAARIPAETPGHQAWVLVVSLEKRLEAYLNTVSSDTLGRVCVRTFELSDEKVERLKIWDDFLEEDLVNRRHLEVRGGDDVAWALELLGIDPERLGLTSECEFPL